MNRKKTSPWAGSMRQEQDVVLFFFNDIACKYFWYESGVLLVCCCSRFLLIMRWWFRLDDWNDNKMWKPEFVIECIYLGSGEWWFLLCGDDSGLAFLTNQNACQHHIKYTLKELHAHKRKTKTHTFMMQCNIFTQHAKWLLSQHKYSMLPRKEQAVNALKMHLTRRLAWHRNFFKNYCSNSDRPARDTKKTFLTSS